MPNKYLRERAMSRQDGRRGRQHVRGHYRDNAMDGHNSRRGMGSMSGSGMHHGGGNYRRDYERGHDYGNDYNRDYNSDYRRDSGDYRGGNDYRSESDYDYGRHNRRNLGDFGEHDYRREERYSDPRNEIRRYDMRRDYNDYNDYNDYRKDYNDYNDYRRDYNDYNDYNDYDYAMENEEYKKDLKEWTQKLKKHDRFGLKEHEIIDKAKQMGVKFDEYSEEEFIATYYMMMSIFSNVVNDLHMYLSMSKSFLEWKEREVSPEEFLCIWYYKIVKGE